MVDKISVVKHRAFTRRFRVDWGKLLTENIELLTFGLDRLADNVWGLDEVCKEVFKKKIPSAVFKPRHSYIMMSRPQLAQERLVHLLDVFERTALFRMVSRWPPVMLYTLTRVERAARLINTLLPHVDVQKVLEAEPHLVEVK